MAAREGNVRTPDVLAFAPTRGVSIMKKRAAYLDIGEGNEFRAFREGKSPKMTPEEAVRYMDRFCFSYRDVPALVRAEHACVESVPWVYLQRRTDHEKPVVRLSCEDAWRRSS